MVYVVVVIVTLCIATCTSITMCNDGPVPIPRNNSGMTLVQEGVNCSALQIQCEELLFEMTFLLSDSLKCSWRMNTDPYSTLLVPFSKKDHSVRVNIMELCSDQHTSSYLQCSTSTNTITVHINEGTVYTYWTHWACFMCEVFLAGVMSCPPEDYTQSGPLLGYLMISCSSDSDDG